jgi:hypothetical protein
MNNFVHKYLEKVAINSYSYDLGCVAFALLTNIEGKRIRGNKRERDIRKRQHTLKLNSILTINLI